MNLVEALSRLEKFDVAVFRTEEVAIILKVSESNASKILKRLSESGQFIRLKRGLWALPNRLDPLALPNYLLAPSICYVSFQSALYYHNIIDQIPEVIYVATLGKTAKFTTPIATVSAHQIHPDFFFDYTYNEKTGVKMATGEKGLVDVLYLSPAKSKIFGALPELDFSNLNIDKIHKIIKKIPSKRRRTLVVNRFQQLTY